MQKEKKSIKAQIKETSKVQTIERKALYTEIALVMNLVPGQPTKPDARGGFIQKILKL